MKAVITALGLVACALSSASTLLVGNYFGDNVQMYDFSSGNLLGSLSGGTLDGPQMQRVGPDGKLYVASELTNSILRYDLAGNFLNVFASGGTLNAPTGVTFDTSGNMLVSNFDSDSVSKFSSTGASLGTLVTSGSGGLDGPDVGTIIGPDGNLYVPSFFGNSILRYNGTTGAFLGAFVGANVGGLTQPRTIIFRNNLVYVSSDNGNKVLRFGLDGTFVDTFVTFGSGGLSGASGMVFGDDGNLYVASWRNNRVLRYNGTTGAFINTFLSSGLNGPTTLSTVPEPASCTLLALGCAWLVRRRKN